MFKGDFESERQVFMITAASMLAHLEYMREQGATTLHQEILKENGCHTTREFVGKLRSAAAAANVELPAYVDDYV